MSMSERKRVDEDHPAFNEYRAKFEALWTEYQPQIDAIEKAGQVAYPNWRGKDSPWDSEKRKVERKFHAAIKKLQEEYAYLFTDDAQNEG